MHIFFGLVNRLKSNDDCWYICRINSTGSSHRKCDSYNKSIYLLIDTRQITQINLNPSKKIIVKWVFNIQIHLLNTQHHKYFLTLITNYPCQKSNRAPLIASGSLTTLAS